jgi:hypothetical protein
MMSRPSDQNGPWEINIDIESNSRSRLTRDSARGGLDRFEGGRGGLRLDRSDVDLTRLVRDGRDRLCGGSSARKVSP